MAEVRGDAEARDVGGVGSGGVHRGVRLGGGEDEEEPGRGGEVRDGGEGAAVGGERGAEQERGLEQRQGGGAEVQGRVPARREARREPRAERELEQREEAEARQGERGARGELGELERVVERARRVPARGRAGDEEPLEGVLHARHVHEGRSPARASARGAR